MSHDVFAGAREIKSSIVMHPQFKGVLQSAEDFIETAVHTRTPLGLVLTADAGMGKTAVLDVIAARIRQRAPALSPSPPLLRIGFDAVVDPHKLAGQLLEALGYPVTPTRASHEAVTKMIDAALERMQPQVLLIDEAQHVCEGCRDITARAVADWLKIRMDKHSLAVVLAGTKVLNRLRDISPQFASRSPADFTIDTFSWGAAWRQLLAGLVENVKSVDLRVLLEPRIAQKAWKGSDGNLRELKHWLASAACCAQMRSSKEVTLEDMQAGFDRIFGTTRKPNPMREGA